MQLNRDASWTHRRVSSSGSSIPSVSFTSTFHQAHVVPFHHPVTSLSISPNGRQGVLPAYLNSMAILQETIETHSTWKYLEQKERALYYRFGGAPRSAETPVAPHEMGGLRCSMEPASPKRELDRINCIPGCHLYMIKF
jgi:hypothetical protein